ncbi:hypothetical protein HNV11_20630 [Spirosoma taeanense]|uniref:Serine/threonine protein phosphatase n=1 Tax=Spirosoma taeanense TaxID=2735870 RepID=A0A6M5YE97_9BACT|nr:hypothetical protein [Spirosoma taeanense]QJW91613.1 hypothetical protein HNV11_20630 [Spirosoma taeanense]
MRSRQQSVGKEAPAYSDNEDASRTDDGAGIWAVADGAGGTGIYAGEWAQYLVRNVSKEPFRDLDQLARWLDNHWERFFNQYQPRTQGDYLIGYKFMHEGSGATLVTLHKQDEQMYWSVYGDAVALCFQPLTGELKASNPDPRQFESAPYLLNWLTPPQSKGFRANAWTHKPGQQYALLSDALGQYVLLAYAVLQGNRDSVRDLAQQPTALGSLAQGHLAHWCEKGSQFYELVWEPLRTALTSADAFKQYTEQLQAGQLLGADDYTAIFIED